MTNAFKVWIKFAVYKVKICVDLFHCKTIMTTTEHL